MSEAKGHLIGGDWQPGEGSELAATNPATGEAYWRGLAASTREVGLAVAAARDALPAWSAVSFAQRVAVLERYRDVLEARKDAIARLISDETGKPRWEAATEAGAMIGKVALTLNAFEQRQSEQSFAMGDATAALRYKPHGVLSVFGPFNLPGHLPNGHIVPALLAGNTVVFKPSEQTPAIGEVMAHAWQEAGLPDGVLNLVQGARDTGVALANHPGHDGILFTGSYNVGAALHRALVDTPQKILALEMGGNNPLVVHQTPDVDAACYTIINSAYITAGQRCTDARRLILIDGDEADAILQRLIERVVLIRYGLPSDSPEPFYGPLINSAAADAMLKAQEDLLARGGRPLVEMKRSERCDALLSPGLVDVTDVVDRRDEEYFGPLLQVVRVRDFDAAIAEANNTSYGLSASLLSASRTLYEQFYTHTRAGIINWNKPTSGASGKLPFGGIGKSGNHRPSGFFAADYCAYPVASVEQPDLPMPATPACGLDALLKP
ncbi:MAG: succinylglutamate-semialdehyde dehydrogenase [Phycisphaerales bacterium JB063]